MRIERPTGYIETFDNGIVHSYYEPGIRVLEEHARAEMEIYAEVAGRFGGQLLLMNDLRGRITAARGARRISASLPFERMYVGFVLNSKIVEVGINFITQLFTKDNIIQQAFQEYDEAYEWLKQFVLPEFLDPPSS